MTGKVLNENQLKMIAVVSMVIDHVGYFLFPQITVLRWIGRLAFPIFAYFIAEGCYYTRNIWRYFTQVAVLGLICVAAVAAADGRIYGNILITFALSILIVALLKLWLPLGIIACIPVLILCRRIEIDYSFAGILIPVFCWAARKAADQMALEQAEEKAAAVGGNYAGDEVSAAAAGTGIPQENGRLAELAVMAVGLLILAVQLEPYQWMGLFALPLLYLYDGTRGRAHLKWFFYLFYPLHIVVIQAVGMLL